MSYAHAKSAYLKQDLKVNSPTIMIFAISWIVALMIVVG